MYSPRPKRLECATGWHRGEIRSRGKSPGRSAGPRFGTLVHTILRDVAAGRRRNHATGEGSWKNSRSDGSGNPNTPTEAVAAALKHPLLERARKSKAMPEGIADPIQDSNGNRILEGVIDLAFEENGIWHIVDFKTDAELGHNRKRYENQLRWYSFALARLNNAPVEAHLLSI